MRKNGAQPKDQFNTWVGLSLAVHAAVLVVFTVKAAFFPSEPLEIRSAIRVDVVAMPEKIRPQAKPKPAPKPAPKVEIKKPEPKPPAPTPEPKVVEKKPALKPKPTPKPEPKKPNSQDAAIDRLKAMQALEKLQEEAEESQEPPKPQEFKGNAINEGDSLTGLDKIQFDRYFSQLRTHVYNNWSLPGWLSDANLSARVLVRMDESGYVTHKQIITSSGNEYFDSKVLETIENASPFPAPPARLSGVLGMRGLELRFPE